MYPSPDDKDFIYKELISTNQSQKAYELCNNKRSVKEIMAVNKIKRLQNDQRVRIGKSIRQAAELRNYRKGSRPV